MGGQAAGAAVITGVIGGVYALGAVAVFRYTAARMPAGIVRRLFSTSRPVTVRVHLGNPVAWDPSRPLGRGGFRGQGVATYSLDDSATVHVTFRQRSGAAVERSGKIPESILPETPETRRRRRIARVVIALYLVMGLVTFGLTAGLTSGSASLRVRVGAFSTIGALSITWLFTHIVLTRAVRIRRAASRDDDSDGQSAVRSHHIAAWIGSLVIVSAVLGVAWRLSNLDQPHPMSWGNSFLSAAVFVLLCTAALTASLHHHTYIHHGHRHR